MAILNCTFASEVMGAQVPFNMVLPEGVTGDIPVVLFLHGLGGDHNEWLNNTPLEQELTARGMAALLPDGQKSWYCDMKRGGSYATYIGRELMDHVRATFPVSGKREKTFAAGLSMGGYGALKLALTYSERFAACAALSGAVDIRARFELGDRHEQGIAIWGEDYVNAIPGSPDDTYALTRRLEEAGKPKPWIYQACGTEDKRLRENRLFRDFIRGRGYTYEYYEGPGRHDWDFWRAQLPILLDFFLNCMKEK